MRISARAEYACLAVYELARRAKAGDPEPLSVQKIAMAQGIPEGFLSQILTSLQSAGIIRSTRGAQGGYRLVKPPDQITLGAVLQAVDGPILPLVCTETHQVDVQLCERSCRCSFISIWQDLAREMRRYVDNLSYDEIYNRLRQEEIHNRIPAHPRGSA